MYDAKWSNSFDDIKKMQTKSRLFFQKLARTEKLNPNKLTNTSQMYDPGHKAHVSFNATILHFEKETHVTFPHAHTQ